MGLALLDTRYAGRWRPLFGRALRIYVPGYVFAGLALGVLALGASAPGNDPVAAPRPHPHPIGMGRAAGHMPLIARRARLR